MTRQVPRDPAPDGSGDTVAVTVVETAACHFCTDAKGVLDDLVGRGYPITVTMLDVVSAEGQALMQRHRAGLSPLVLVDGRFFSQGRLPRRKLDSLVNNQFPTWRPGSEA